MEDLEEYTATTYRVTKGNCVKGFRFCIRVTDIASTNAKSLLSINQKSSIHNREIKRRIAQLTLQ